jgi:hypothetical protein
MKAFGLSSVAAVCLTTLSAALSPIPADDSLLAKRAPVDAAEIEGTIFERGYHHGKHRQSQFLDCAVAGAAGERS